ncbi:unnamed protein product [Clavelina lepadiformis]|uniref:Uncharacterized protein n=1 Tax=Clavelina lepadiformis TaxID=159417 RepID=A0ABP0G122_CLALP
MIYEDASLFKFLGDTDIGIVPSSNQEAVTDIRSVQVHYKDEIENQQIEFISLDPDKTLI